MACSAGSPTDHPAGRGTVPRLEVRGLTSRWAGPFDFAAAAGECVAVSGPSGAGKSLLLRMIADLDPNQGSVWLDGRERGSVPAPAWRRQVVYVPAEPGWWADRAAAHFPGAALAEARAMAPRLGLDAALLEAAVARLSTGERQRLALIRTLLLGPPVLLLDEPTGPLDPANAARVEALLAGLLAEGRTIVLVTHDLALAARLARQHLRLEAGKVVPVSPPVSPRAGR